MRFEGFRYEGDQQQDAADQNQDAKTEWDKKPTEKADFLTMTSEQQQAAEAGHDKYAQLSAQWETESHQSKAEAAGTLSEAMQNIYWV